MMDTGQSTLPTLREHLAATLEEGGLSQARLSKRLQRSPAQISRWLSGTDEPNYSAVLDLVAALGLEGRPGGEAFLALHQVAELQKSLLRVLREATPYLGIRPGLLNRLLVEKSRELQHETMAQTLSEKAHHNAKMLMAILRVTRDVKAFLEGDSPLLTEDNIAQHLTYPANRIIGVFLDLDSQIRQNEGSLDLLNAFRRNSLNTLRAASQIRSNASTRSLAIKRHSLHLLARHGEAKDEEFVEYQMTQDPETQRMATYGLILGKSRADLLETMVFNLSKNEALLDAAVDFDALHYGDLKAISLLNKQGGIVLLQTIPHILRQVTGNPDPLNKELALLKFERALARSRLDVADAVGAPHSLKEDQIAQLIATLPSLRSRKAREAANLIIKNATKER